MKKLDPMSGSRSVLSQPPPPPFYGCSPGARRPCVSQTLVFFLRLLCKRTFDDKWHKFFMGLCHSCHTTNQQLASSHPSFIHQTLDSTGTASFTPALQCHHPQIHITPKYKTLLLVPRWAPSQYVTNIHPQSLHNLAHRRNDNKDWPHYVLHAPDNKGWDNKHSYQPKPTREQFHSQIISIIQFRTHTCEQ